MEALVAKNPITKKLDDSQTTLLTVEMSVKLIGASSISNHAFVLVVRHLPGQQQAWGRYHGGRRPSGNDRFHSPTVIPLSSLCKPSIMKRCHRRWTCSHTSPRSLTMVALHDTRFVECWWWNDGWTENCRHLTVVGLHDTGPRGWFLLSLCILFHVESSQWFKIWYSSGYPEAWRQRVSDGTGVCELQVRWNSLIGNFYLSVAARTIVSAELSLWFTSMLSNQLTTF